jgi:hypothetical protein
LPVPASPTVAIAGQPARASLQFNALAAQVAFLLAPPKLILTTTLTVALPASITTWTDLPFDTELSDQDGMHTGSNAASTVLTTGWWEVEAATAVAPGTDSLARALRIASSGSATQTLRLAQLPAVATAGVGTVVAGGTEIYLVAGDLVKIQAASGTALSTAAADTRLAMRWVSQ